MSAIDKLQKYGPTEDRVLADGTLVQVFASHIFPAEYLLEENWAEVTNCGHFRTVRFISKLKDGTPVRMFAKSAERVFTAESKLLDKGRFWWGGSRSGEKRVFIPNHSLVEERTVWEAAYLLELNWLGISAEQPQALVTRANGDKELIVAGVGGKHLANSLTGDIKLMTSLTEAGFLPDDLQALVDGDKRHIIDVNRWEWAPFTNGSRENLLKLIRNRASQ